ncbi:Os08g0418300 [Oryza sativa Japonica Group]|uniref:Os08g0418300 protein n=1 Tax=Oryza sativa subsp. japonica TaxID=39947 RepID=A0A0P0XGA1_ORYSJ|nr:Os08g0418300 [Oryza sativa Japonica Group]
MAGVEAALLPPPPPPPQARWASVAATLLRLLALAADVLVYGLLAAMWLNNAAFAAAIFSRWASGEGSTTVAILSCSARGEGSAAVAVAAATKVFWASFLAVGVFFPFAGPLLMWRLGIGPPPPPETRESGSGGRAAAQRGRRGSTGPASRRQEGGGRPVALLFMFFSWWVAFAGILLQELAPEKASCQEKGFAEVKCAGMGWPGCRVEKLKSISGSGTVNYK